MNPSRTFSKRISELTKAGYDPTLMIPVIEVLEETLLGFQSDVMSDKDLPTDEKGRMGIVITPLIKAVRAASEQCKALRQITDTPQKPKLHNSHLK